MNEQVPLAYSDAAIAEARCVAATVRLLTQHRLHMPRSHIGARLHFADGTSAPVYRETTVDHAPVDPCVLFVAFRLRGVRGRGHALFRHESLLNTPLFVGFPGYVSKLWLAHDANGIYRGVYEWDGPGHAQHYAQSLWRVLGLVTDPGSIRYHVVPHLTRNNLLPDPTLLSKDPSDNAQAWWRLSAVT